jgi:hypothetical protein
MSRGLAWRGATGDLGSEERSLVAEVRVTAMSECSCVTIDDLKEVVSLFHENLPVVRDDVGPGMPQDQ